MGGACVLVNLVPLERLNASQTVIFVLPKVMLPFLPFALFGSTFPFPLPPSHHHVVRMTLCSVQALQGHVKNRAPLTAA